MAIDGVVCFAEVEINLVQGDFINGGQFLLELQFNDGGTRAPVGVEPMGAIMKGNLGFHPRVNDGLTDFPSGLKKTDAADPSIGLGQEGQSSAKQIYYCFICTVLQSSVLSMLKI